MTDSPEDELGQLQKRKEELKSKLEAIERDRNAMEEGIRILREKAAIRELEEKVREEQNVFSRLSFEKKELEERLSQPSKFSMIKAVEKTKTELEDKRDTFETEAKEQRETEETEQRETEETEQRETEETEQRETEETEQVEAIWKKSEEKSESEKEPQEQESKKKLRFF